MFLFCTVAKNKQTEDYLLCLFKARFLLYQYLMSLLVLFFSQRHELFFLFFDLPRQRLFFLVISLPAS